jgi:hypothetical protein
MLAAFCTNARAAGNPSAESGRLQRFLFVRVGVMPDVVDAFVAWRGGSGVTSAALPRLWTLGVNVSAPFLWTLHCRKLPRAVAVRSPCSMQQTLRGRGPTSQSRQFIQIRRRVDTDWHASGAGPADSQMARAALGNQRQWTSANFAFTQRGASHRLHRRLFQKYRHVKGGDTLRSPAARSGRRER